MEDIFNQLSEFDPKHPAVLSGIFPLGAFFQGTKIPQMSGCFLEGTQILLESYEEKPVENLTVAPMDKKSPPGDILLSVDGVKTYVIAKVAAKRIEPYIHLKARTITPPYSDKLLEVTVSSNHVFAIDFTRIVQALYLGQGRRVRTIYGDAIIEEIRYSQQENKVWNVYLASERFVTEVYPNFKDNRERLFTFLFNSSLGLTQKQHLLFGNGFLSGDFFLQFQADEISSEGISLNKFI